MGFFEQRYSLLDAHILNCLLLESQIRNFSLKIALVDNLLE